MYDRHKTVQSIIDEIDRCIKENCGESLTLSILSRKFGYSEYHFSRMFKEISGMRLRDYMSCLLYTSTESATTAARAPRVTGFDFFSFLALGAFGV